MSFLKEGGDVMVIISALLAVQRVINSMHIAIKVSILMISPV